MDLAMVYFDVIVSSSGTNQRAAIKRVDTSLDRFSWAESRYTTFPIALDLEKMLDD